MGSKLLSYGKLEIPEALTLEHEELQAKLTRAAAKPGRIGKAAARVARLCRAHFAKEEENIFRVFGLLHALASDRVQPEMAAEARMAVQLSARQDALSKHHRLINAAIEKLLQQGREDEDNEIVELAAEISDHERIEDEVTYPAVLSIARSVQESAGMQKSAGN